MSREAERYFAPPQQGLALWGSSSMRDGMPDQGTPLPVRFADRLAPLFPTVLQQAVGGTVSGHCLLQRGLRDAAVTVATDSRAPAADGVPVTVEGLGPCLGFRLPGELEGVGGVLTATWEQWTFTPGDPAAAVRSGRFRSMLPAHLAGLRHVLWTGKNNILDVDQVLADVEELYEDAPSLVLGHWSTPSDPVGSDTGEAVAAVNAAQQKAYGVHFVDLGGALRDPDVLSRPVVAPLRLMEQGSTHEALGRGITPPLLVADDDVHLNGWGNLLVLDLLVERLRKLGWTA